VNPRLRPRHASVIGGGQCWRSSLSSAAPRRASGDLVAER
jgi:hypothetical protein